MSVRVRLVACMSVVGLLLILVCGIGVVALRRASNAAAEVGVDLTLTHDAMQAKFRTADFAGWQTGYAFDSIRGVPDAAQDTVGQRQEFLASTSAFAVDLDRLDAYGLTAKEQADLDAARSAFSSFLAVDQKIDAGYRRDTPASVRQANALASGRSLDLFGRLATHINNIATSVTARGQAARRASIDSTDAANTAIIVAGVTGLVLAAACGTLVVRSVTRPLMQLRRRMEEIADGNGDLTQRMDTGGQDELSVVAAAFNRFAASLATTMRTIHGRALNVSAASRQLSTTSDAIADNARTASAEATTAGAASGQVADHITTASAGSEQMTASIREIASSAAGAAEVAAHAVDRAEHTNAVVAGLNDASGQISEVIALIAGVAQQTNLLALNATIEAARAGEAGKGFAVVAGEVKALAQETSRATEEISHQVANVQAQTTTAMEAISDIGMIIGEISQYATTIAAAVEQQSAVSADMSRAVSEAANNSSIVATNIHQVTAANRATTQGIDDSQQAIHALTRMGSELEDAIAGFRF